MPRSSALWITFREVSRSVRWPKLLQPSPTAETRKPEPPRLRICMELSCDERRGRALWRAPKPAASHGSAKQNHVMGGKEALRSALEPPPKKTRPRSDAATDTRCANGGKPRKAGFPSDTN